MSSIPQRKTYLARALAIVATAYFVTACQNSLTRVQVPRLAYTEPPATTLDPRDVASTIARLRGIPTDKPLKMAMLDGPAFVERLHAHESGRTFDGPHKSFWAGFHFATDDRQAVRAQRSAIDDALSGFYDPSVDELFIRKGGLSLDSARFTIVHEIAHAVQYRLGLVPGHGTTMDEDLARRALFEGDANLTAAGYLALREHRALGVAVARIRDRVRRMSDDELAAAPGVHMQVSLLEAPALARARMFFPYVEGTAFATALYQSGGMPLLNAALAHPPVSTEQVLHPEKYLAGELPIPVSTPIVSDGTLVEHGTLGELQTAVYLAQCLSDGAARRAAEGWGGDAYAVVVDGHGEPATLWSTVWDDEEAAARFETAVRARELCTQVGQAPKTLRRGTSVTVVDAPDVSRYDLEGLLARGQPVSPAPPLGPVVYGLIPPPEPLFLHKGRLDASKFTSEPLGLVARLPTYGRWPISADLPSDGPEMRFTSHLLAGSMFFLFDPVSAEIEKGLMDKLLTDILQGDEYDPEKRDAYVARLSIGLADVEELQSVRGVRLATAFVPVCNGEATLVLVSVAAQLGPSPAAWFDSVRITSSSPACNYLESLEAPASRTRGIGSAAR